MTFSIALLVIALVLFLAAALNVPSPINLEPLGLAFLVAAEMVRLGFLH